MPVEDPIQDHVDPPYDRGRLLPLGPPEEKMRRRAETDPPDDA